MEQPNEKEAAAALAAFADGVKADVEAKMRALLDARLASATKLGENAGRSIEAVRDLAMRGGKRVRAVLAAATYEACRGEGGAARIANAGVALELLQTYLLVHDDWMDDDDVRRGGASVHAMLRARFASRHHGDCAAILGGDYACALAQEALMRVDVAPSRLLEATRLFAKIQEEVVLGQMLDVNPMTAPPGRDAVEAMHDLKTGSYTVRGPVTIGATLAGAGEETRKALGRFASTLGIAFQLQDDLLGTFGDPARIGKPVGSDIRKGKRTALIAEIESDRASRAVLDRAFGVEDASDDDVEAVRRRIVDSGAKRAIEVRIAALSTSSLEALHDAPVDPRGALLLRGIARSMVDRDR